MTEPPDSHADYARDPALEAVYRAVAAALAEHDKATAVRTAVEAVTTGAVAIPALYRDVLARILMDTGAAWQGGKVAIWEEHLASATVRTIVEILYPGVLKVKAAATSSGRTVLLACPPEEGHDLGLRMVSTGSTWPAGRRTSSGRTLRWRRWPTRRGASASTRS